MQQIGADLLRHKLNCIQQNRCGTKLTGRWQVLDMQDFAAPFAPTAHSVTLQCTDTNAPSHRNKPKISGQQSIFHNCGKIVNISRFLSCTEIPMFTDSKIIMTKNTSTVCIQLNGSQTRPAVENNCSQPDQCLHWTDAWTKHKPQ